MQFQASDTLKSRSYLSLIIAQFLAAFNDQAIHIVAIFYAGDLLARYVGLRGIGEEEVIFIVTACFISPFFLFSPLAGVLADKYSKRSIIVAWKLAEVFMMGIALVGFLLPFLADYGWGSPETLAVWSALLVVSGVFLMGTHSAFFVPAKYGVMPEILQPVVLSRGNGFLEGTSFVSQILGTVVGGILYGSIREKAPIRDHMFVPSNEWLIGLLLFGLAVIGAVVSFFVARVPASTPDRRITWKLWEPLKNNLGNLRRSKPLELAVLGIAFFTFMVLFTRQTLLYDGEIQKELQAAKQRRAEIAAKDAVEPDDWPDVAISRDEDIESAHVEGSPAQKMEMRVAFLIAFISLGIGVGAPIAGALSGNKVELGLVPIGAVFLIAFTASMGLFLQWTWPTRICLMLIGMAASFYIVPLYTLLQHRAPKDSKGSLVATSNFVNVAGGLVAVGAFYLVSRGLKLILGLTLTEADVPNDLAMIDVYINQLQRTLDIPRLLFLVASGMTAAILILLCRQLPDFFVRSLLWLRSHGRYRLKVIGLNNLPSEGPVILAANCDDFETCMQVVTATDRFTRFVLLESDPDERPPWLIRYLARRTGLVAMRPAGEPREAWDRAISKAAKALSQGNILGITAAGRVANDEMTRLCEKMRQEFRAPILPVYCGALAPHSLGNGKVSVIRRMQVVIGRPVAADAAPEEIRRTIHLLGEWMRQTDSEGIHAVTSMIPAAVVASPKVMAPVRPENP
jgi:acyl-[acyl-carrier-protein]-phospholipid O-acyltransferase/long-chain-fatty-acid--[acyl-carrier-protein] ligase